MALITPTVTKLSGGILYKWEQITENDTCKPVLPGTSFRDKTFQVTGTFGGGAIALRGTLDSTQSTVSSFAALNDYQGDPIAPTAAAILAVSENCLKIAPGTPSGTSVDIDAWLLCVG